MGLRVLYDGYWLHDGPPSGRNVAGSVLRAWAETFPDDELVVALPVADDVPVPVIDALPVTRRHVPAPVANHQVWVRTRLGAAGSGSGADAIVSQNFLPGPRFAGQTAVVVYDLIFRDHPEWFTLPERLYLRGIAGAMRQASAVITISEAERARIARWFPAAAARVHAYGLGLPAGIAAASPAPVERASEKPFILAVGRLNVRKNLNRLIEAYSSSPALTAGFDLVIVGEANGRSEAREAEGAAGRIDFLGGVDDGSLKWLYQHAEALAFPSLDEGFGLPLLEARTFGARTAASDIPVFRELGFADAYFDPQSVDSIRASLEALLVGGAAGEPLRGDPGRYSWEAMAAGIRGQLAPADVSVRAAS